MEQIILAALRTSDRVVHVGLQPKSRHMDIIHHLASEGFESIEGSTYGFLTSEGRFLDRGEALQLLRDQNDTRVANLKYLSSENLW